MEKNVLNNKYYFSFFPRQLVNGLGTGKRAMPEEPVGHGHADFFLPQGMGVEAVAGGNTNQNGGMDMAGDAKSKNASKSEAREPEANRLNDKALEKVAGGAGPGAEVPYCYTCNIFCLLDSVAQRHRNDGHHVGIKQVKNISSEILR